MELVSTRSATLARAEALAAGALAAAAAVVVAVLAPPGGDAAAHLYRSELVRDGVTVWDNLWYAGHYPLASYSLLYYFPAALVGNVPVVLAAVVASAALFAAIAAHEWGDAARWPARAFAVLAAGPLYTGTYSYALGLAAGLGTLRLLQLRRGRLALGCAALALGSSPLAFVFLSLVLAGALVARRRLDRRAAGLAVGLAALAGLQAVVLAAFPSDGVYRFSPLSLAAVLSVSALGAAVALRAPRARALAAFFVLWGLVCTVGFLVESPFGDNLTRLRALVFPLVLLAALLAGFRPRWLAVPAVGFALFYNVAPDIGALPKRAGDVRTAEASFWEPALDFLRSHAEPGYRVEVVPTFGHWEAYRLPRQGFALARGWYRQIDLAANPELYRDPLEPAQYRRWLRDNAVRHVLLPRARLGPMGADREAELLRSGQAGLERVLATRDWTVYELPGAEPVLTGPAAARVERLDHKSIAGRVSAAGTYRLRVRWTPYWQVARGDVCLARSADGMTRLVARRPGRFELGASVLDRATC